MRARSSGPMSPAARLRKNVRVLPAIEPAVLFLAATFQLFLLNSHKRGPQAGFIPAVTLARQSKRLPIVVGREGASRGRPDSPVLFEVIVAEHDPTRIWTSARG